MTLADISMQPRLLRISRAAARVTATEKSISGLGADDYAAARIAGIQAAKTAAQLIVSCHQAPIEAATVTFDASESTIGIAVEIKAIHRTDLNCEALLAASVAATALAAMLEEAVIEHVHIVPGRGAEKLDVTLRRAGILVLSDSVAAGKAQDRSGALIKQALEGYGVGIAHFQIMPDDEIQIAQTLTRWCDDAQLDLIVTTGGTGLGPRDHTPEAFTRVVERDLPGIAEALRVFGQERTDRAMLSRGRAGQRGKTVLVALPGSAKAVAESLAVLLPALLHSFAIIEGGGHGDAASSA